MGGTNLLIGFFSFSVLVLLRIHATQLTVLVLPAMADMLPTTLVAVLATDICIMFLLYVSFRVCLSGFVVLWSIQFWGYVNLRLFDLLSELFLEQYLLVHFSDVYCDFSGLCCPQVAEIGGLVVLHNLFDFQQQQQKKKILELSPLVDWERKQIVI